MRIVNDQYDIGSDLSVSQVGPAIYLGHIPYYSIQLAFTGSPAGSFKLQCSNDVGRLFDRSNYGDTDTLINWTDVTDSATAVSGAGDFTYSVSDAGYKWVRLVWTPTSGSGTITSSRWNGKGI